MTTTGRTGTNNQPRSIRTFLRNGTASEPLQPTGAIAHHGQRGEALMSNCSRNFAGLDRPRDERLVSFS